MNIDAIASELSAAHSNQGQAMPEKRLLAAVLMAAVSDLRDGLSLADPQGSSDLRALVGWFRSTDRRWMFSFESVCAQLDLDARAVRKQLLASLEYSPMMETRVAVNT